MTAATIATTTTTTAVVKVLSRIEGPRGFVLTTINADEGDTTADLIGAATGFIKCRAPDGYITVDGVEYVAPVKPAKPKAASMVAIRSAMPEFFNADGARLVAGLSDAGARVEALAYALTGDALQRAQSGNLGAQWAACERAAESLKGQTKARAQAAIAYVAGIKPGSLSGPVEAFQGFADETLPHLLSLLTPIKTAKAASVTTNWKQECLTARAELAVMADHVEALKALLKAQGIKAPTMPTEAPAPF